MRALLPPPLALVAALFCVSEAQSASPTECRDLLTNAGQKTCAENEYRSVAAELETAYQRVIDRASQADARRTVSAAGEKPSAVAVAESQRAWTAYRDAECKGVVGSGGGSGRAVWVLGCLAEKAHQRIKELDTPYDQR